MQLSELDTITKNINYCGKLYTFTVYVTAWDKLCMAYANVENPHEDRIFSVVIDPESCYTLIDVNPDGISTVHTPDDAVRHVRKCYELLINGDNDIAELEIAEADRGVYAKGIGRVGGGSALGLLAVDENLLVDDL